jgi:hypothetical protein
MQRRGVLNEQVEPGFNRSETLDADFVIVRCSQSQTVNQTEVT